MAAAHVTSKGQIVIPAEIRKRHGIRKGTRIVFEERGDEILMTPITEDFIRRMAGCLGSDGPSWTQELIEEHAREREREDQ